MSEGKRPGGLTALAVLNFVFGGFGALSFLAMLGLLAAADEEGGELAQGAARTLQALGMAGFWVVLGVTVVLTGLLIASGVGYLKQKKVLGRTLGNAYAILSILYSVVRGMELPEEAGGGFHLGTIIGLIYPVLTLVLLNTTFKEDFIR